MKTVVKTVEFDLWPNPLYTVQSRPEKDWAKQQKESSQTYLNPIFLTFYYGTPTFTVIHSFITIV